MKTIYNKQNKKITFWSEDVNGNTDYWKKVYGLSWTITKRQFDNLTKKHAALLNENADN